MSKFKFEVDDYYELLSLHKALLEAKFHKNPDNIYVCFSPIIAKLSNEIVDILSTIESEKNEEKWKQWRMIENKSYFRECALANAISYERWGNMTYDEKIQASKNLLSPFVASNKEIESFISEVDRNKTIISDINK